jgi:prepilin-type N-terminal cleavage/methylation domain-containing protein
MYPSPKSQGFTLIEMIVALGLFAVVASMTTGAILMLVATNQTFHRDQTIMTNLAFALDSMTREIRTGRNYVCVTSSTMGKPFVSSQAHETNGMSELPSGAPVEHRDCASGRNGNQLHGVSFQEAGASITNFQSTRILYFYDSTARMLYRRVGNNPAEPLVSDEILITDANFFVHGTTPLLTTPPAPIPDRRQPMVTIFIEAQSNSGGTPVTRRLQTTISQRSLDI